MGTSKVIILSGATATGKSQMAIDIATHLHSLGPWVIVNFDSLLFYKELSIGTAKPTQEEMKQIPHEMVDVVHFHNPLNASDYIKMATPVINKHLKEGKKIILTGGSAFYLRALIKGMYDSEPVSKLIRQEVHNLFESEGIDGVRAVLKKHDPLSFQNLHENDVYRNIRAVEHFLSTGYALSTERLKKEEDRPYDLSLHQHGWDLTHFYLEIPKEAHWEIMKKRTQTMVKIGLINEVQGLLNLGATGLEKPLQSIGYKETLAYLNGHISSTEQLIDSIYLSTRKLAKAQKTFWNKLNPKQPINPLKDSAKLIQTLTKSLNS